MEYDPSNLTPGTVLDGRLRVEKQIGSGAYATVYLVHHTGLDKPLAMKVLHANIAMNKGPARHRFFMEARLLARLRHENIVSVQDVVENGVCFITMDFIPGEDAYTRMRRSPMRAHEALYIVAGVLSGLEAVHAHEPPIYHRDIKPENVRLELDANGKVKRVVLIDFGVAHFRPQEDPNARQMTDTRLGSYSYISPEADRGDPDVDHRTDIFSVGAMLWALMKGEAPTNIVFVDKDPKLLAGFPKPVADIIRRAVQYNKAKRFPDAATMRREVLQAMDVLSQPAVVRRPWLRIPNPFAGRTVNWRGLAVIAAGLALAGAGVGWRMTAKDTTPATDIVPVVQVASRALEEPMPVAATTAATATEAVAVKVPPVVELVPEPVVVQATVEKPKTQKAETPPDTTPRLVHKLVKKAKAGSTITITASVKNVTVKEVWLFSRTEGTTRWESVRMSADNGYSGKLTATAPGVEYYIDVRPEDNTVIIQGDGNRDTYSTISVD